MIDREANRLFHTGSRRETIRTVLGAAAGLCAAAAFGYFGFFYEGWLPFPGRNNVFFIDHGELVKDQWIAQDGVPVFHTDSTGKRVTGLYETEDGTYCFDENGRKMSGLQEMADGTRYFDESGRMAQGWLTIDGEEYFFAEDGTRRTGWVQDGGSRYWLRADGSRFEGWGQIDGERYYFDPEDGRMLTGWNEVDDHLMYFGETGIMQTGRIELDGGAFYLEEDGTVSPGWHEIESGGEEEEERFYVCRDGSILQTDKETGNAGRLIIPDCGIDVALNKAGSRDEYQTVTDEENSALIVKERRDVESVIADRRSQGFAIAKAVEDKSFAYIVDEKGQITEYICTNSSLGRNTGEDVVDENNQSVWGQNAGGFCTYTSAGNGEAGAVRIVFWQPV